LCEVGFSPKAKYRSLNSWRFRL